MADPVLPVPGPARPDGRHSSPSAADLGRLAAKLGRRIRGQVRCGDHDRQLYATDASIYQVEPLGVVVPADADDLRAVVRFAAEHRLPILPRGGGTSLAGQAVGPALIIDCSPRCRRILDVDVAARTATVEPGVVLDQLNRHVAPHGLMFGPDVATAAHATIGGMIGNNSAGAHSILYGRTVEHVAALDVLLADGAELQLTSGGAARDPRVGEMTRRIRDVILPLADDIDRRFPTIVRHVDGYNLDLVLRQIRESSPTALDQVNLAHLVCGSEGTLAVTARATLRLVDAPRRRALAIVSFSSIDEALQSLGHILATSPAAVEMLDEMVIALARQNLEYRRYVELLPQPAIGEIAAVLYVEYFGDSPESIDRSLASLAACVGGFPMNQYRERTEMHQAWQLRRAGEPLLHAIPGLRKPVSFIEDTAVDPARLPEFVREFRAIVTRHGTVAAYYAHASVGCLHIRPLVCLRDEHDRELMLRMAEEVTDLVRRFGGALSGEHGNGRARSHLLQRFYGPAICEAFSRIKAIFDPEHRLNPGNIVDPPPMLSHLRVMPREQVIQVPQVRTFYRYDREHGFAEAVEACNGAGVCRRLQGGTMCPSYRGTLDERHATRGRGNALRLAITGQFSADRRSPAWSDDETLATLDLCLSCKGCKTECPSNVDIAKLKAEYLAQRYAHGGRIPLASRVFASVRQANRLGSALHPIANRLMSLRASRWALSMVLEIDPRRQLPAFSRSLYRWFHRRPVDRASIDRPAVILLPDCFSVYNESHIGRAACRALEAFGYRVILPRMGCCGRAAISLGMLGRAARLCRDAAWTLQRAIDRHQAVAVVGLEPSCVSAIKDDWLELEMDVNADVVRGLAERTFLIEDFLDRRWTEHPIRLEIEPWTDGPPVLLHGHCHQKSLWGVETSSRLLRRLVGPRLRVLDTGCCGMAGSFGYTRAHYDLSMRIAELDLLQALRAEPGAMIVAPGTSCRHQIHDGEGRQAIHPIELLAHLVAR